MCNEYDAVTQTDHLLQFFGVQRDLRRDPLPESEVHPTKRAPFIRLSAEGERIVENGHFGLLPEWAKEVAYGKRTNNARSETIAEKVSFRKAWARGQRCIVPAWRVYEFCHETGKPVRWRIQRPVGGGVPLHICGVWSETRHVPGTDGAPTLSFAMITVNADGHPIFQRMHAPGREKRMPVFMDDEEDDRWLTCSVDEARSFFRQWDGALESSPAPRASRKRNEDDVSGDLDFEPAAG